MPGLPLILCYHKIERRAELGVTRLSPRRFARQVERFARQGWASVTLNELLACARGEREAGPREVVFTFDDAYRGLRDHAFPVLAAHGYTAICSVVTDYAGRLNRWDVAYGGRRFAHLAWRDMRRWQDRGMEFISHTVTHPWLPWLDEGECFDELMRSRCAIESALDVAPLTVSYPYGACEERETRLAEAAGYAGGLTLARRWRGDAFAIPRLPVYRWSPPMPGIGVLAPLERLAGAAANGCAVGTELWKGLRKLRSGEVARDDGEQRRLLHERVREHPA